LRPTIDRQEGISAVSLRRALPGVGFLGQFLTYAATSCPTCRSALPRQRFSPVAHSVHRGMARFGPAGGWDIYGDETKEVFVYVFETATGKLVRRLGKLAGVIKHLTFSPDGKYLAATNSTEFSRLEACCFRHVPSRGEPRNPIRKGLLSQKRCGRLLGESRPRANPVRGRGGWGRDRGRGAPES
jgi:hypothetical protein